MLCFIQMAQSQSSNHLLRTPAISPDGSTIAFSYQGDIWKVASNGGDAQRMTVHESYEGDPQWSPDGTQIAYSSNRHGNNDIFVLSLKGENPPKRLTYHSSSDRSAKWMGNDHLVFCTRRAFAQVEREQEIHSVEVNGNTPSRTMDAMGRYALGVSKRKVYCFY